LLSDADRAEARRIVPSGIHKTLVDALANLRTGKSRVSVYCVAAKDRSLCEGILAYFERAGWKVAKDAKTMPHTPAWDTRMGIVVEGAKAPEIVDALMRIYADVKVGRMNVAEKEGYGERVRIYVVRPPASLSEP